MSFEERLIEEVNLFRRNPTGYCEKLKKNKQYFKGDNIWRHPKCAIETVEGVKAFDDAIDFLRKKTTKSAHELSVSKGLTSIAKDFLKAFKGSPTANVPLEPVIEKYGAFKGNFRRFVQFGGFSPEQKQQWQNPPNTFLIQPIFEHPIHLLFLHHYLLSVPLLLYLPHLPP